MTDLLLFHPQLVFCACVAAWILGIIVFGLSRRARLVVAAFFVLLPITPILATRLIAVGIIAVCDWLIADRACTRRATHFARRLADEFNL